MKGRVIDAGGGHVTVLVDRDTTEYLWPGTRVEIELAAVRPQMYCRAVTTYTTSSNPDTVDKWRSEAGLMKKAGDVIIEFGMVEEA